MKAIVDSLRSVIKPIIVRYNWSASGSYLNLYNKPPMSMDEELDNIAHLSFHTVNDLYHFKIMKPQLINPPLPEPEHDKKYTITFKIYKNKKTSIFSAYIIKGLHNRDTEEECPDKLIETFHFVLDNIVRCLNTPVAGKTRRHKRINKKQPEKSRSRCRSRSRRMR